MKRYRMEITSWAFYRDNARLDVDLDCTDIVSVRMY